MFVCIFLLFGLFMLLLFLPALHSIYFICLCHTYYFAFVDLEKAFDRVPKEVTRWALRKAGVDEWLVKAVMAMYEGAQTVVRTTEGRISSRICSESPTVCDSNGNDFQRATSRFASRITVCR